jgi:phage shock protein A
MRNPITGFFGLLGWLFQSGADKIEDPAYTLERAYAQQLQALEETRRGRLEIETIGARLDLELRQLGEGVASCEDQARRAMLAGREDLARMSIGRREELREQEARTRAERERLEEDRRGLHQQESELSGAVQAFRSRKEVLKAQYGATRARLRVGEALTGYSRTVTSVGDDVRRFEERLLTLKARATALETVAIGPVAGSMIAPTYVERELTYMSVSPRVEEELDRLRGELGLPERPAAIASPVAAPADSPTSVPVEGVRVDQPPREPKPLDRESLPRESRERDLPQRGALERETLEHAS